MNARTRIMLSINQLEDDLITLRQRIKQLCPMCGDAPAKNDSICQECEDYCNAPTVEAQHYELYVKRFGEDHPETIRVGAFLGLL